MVAWAGFIVYNLFPVFAVNKPYPFVFRPATLTRFIFSLCPGDVNVSPLTLVRVRW